MSSSSYTQSMVDRCSNGESNLFNLLSELKLYLSHSNIALQGVWLKYLFMATDLGPVRATREKKKKVVPR